MTKGHILVVAGALEGADDAWLMHCRPLDKHHGGLWEFPGGKVEPLEKPIESLCRELKEELGIVVLAEHCLPIGFAEDRASDGHPGLVILLYKISHWTGEPSALEGGEVGWFSKDEVRNLSKPPLDVELAASLFAKAPA